MSDDATAVTTLEAVERAHATVDDSFGPPCLGCGLRNPAIRRSCLACGAPLGGHDELAGPLPIDPPLLERQRETAQLRAVVETFLAQKHGGLVAISAERGLGTTRLLRFVAEQLLESGTTRVLTTTVRDADGPYAPITRLLWERFGVTPSKGPQTARSEITSEVHRVLAARGGPPTEHARRIVVAAGLPGDGATRWETDGARALPRLADSVARFIQSDAATQPTALLVDNLDGASDDGLALFEAVARALGDAVLIVCAGGPAVAERLSPLAPMVVTPQPLSREACATLCHHLLRGVEVVQDELVAAVSRSAEGSPGRVREILLALIESRVIVVDEVPWRIDLASLGPDGPVSPAEVLSIRLARLDPEARAVLSRAAIVGEVFWEGAVLAMTRVEENVTDPFAPDTAPPKVYDALRRLVAAEMLAPIEESELAYEREYAFGVSGLRDHVLNEQDDAIRRARHDVCASWLELAAGPRADDLARAIASHLEKAGLHQAAAQGYLRAGRAARASYRGPVALQLFDKALALLPAGNAPDRIDALHDRGVVLAMLGRGDEALASFMAMLTLALQYGARNKMAAALGRIGRLCQSRGELEDARTHLGRALELFVQAEDTRGVAAVHDDLGRVAFVAGDFDGSLAHHTRALEIRRGLADDLGEALSTHNLGLLHYVRGQPRQSRAHLERALALREKHGDLEGAVTTRNVLAVIACERGDVAQAEAAWTEILQLAEALGDKRTMVIVAVNLGELAVDRADAMEAGRLLDMAESLAQSIGDRRALVEIACVRGDFLRRNGDVERARTLLEDAAGVARASGLREVEARALRGLGEVCATTVFDASGDTARAADAYFVAAIRILDELGATRELARTQATFGAFLLERGETATAREQLSQAVPVLERMELAEAARARTALNRAGGEMRPSF